MLSVVWIDDDRLRKDELLKVTDWRAGIKCRLLITERAGQEECFQTTGLLDHEHLRKWRNNRR